MSGVIFPGSMDQYFGAVREENARNRRAQQVAEAEKWIDKAAEHDITLELKNFRVIDGALTVDGMPPGDWLDAMTMD